MPLAYKRGSKPMPKGAMIDYQDALALVAPMVGASNSIAKYCYPSPMCSFHNEAPFSHNREEPGFFLMQV